MNSSPNRLSAAPTIDDLRVKLCWICREEEIRDVTSSAEPRRAWVHPCSCTLVAHQDCLLEWIKESQSQPNRRANALKCPQCNTKYMIESRNPLILRILENMNQLAVRGGIYVSLGVVAGLGFSFLASIYAFSTYYGAHAVRVFVGDRMYNVIIGDDPQNWHWSVYWNLPLVPLYLIAADPISLSSSLSSSASFLFSNISLPLILSLAFPSTSVLAASHKAIDLSNLSDVLSPSSNHHLHLRHVFSYPPPPSLCLLTFPFIRAVYVSMRWRLIRWALTLPREADSPGRGVGRPVWVIGGDDENEDDDGDADEGIGADIRIDVDIDRAANEGGPQGDQDQVVEQQQQQQQQRREDDQQPQQQQHENQNQNLDVENRNWNANELRNQARNQGGRRVRVTFSSIGRYLSRVLLTPWIASYSGRVLELISRKWGFLRLILALDTDGGSGKSRIIGTGTTTGVGIGRVMEWIRRITSGGLAGPSRTQQSMWKASTVEPIWWRNSVGLSLWMLTRDAITILYLLLKKREMESRKIVNRSFEGIDIGTLDLVHV